MPQEIDDQGIAVFLFLWYKKSVIFSLFFPLGGTIMEMKIIWAAVMFLAGWLWVYLFVRQLSHGQGEIMIKLPRNKRRERAVFLFKQKILHFPCFLYPLYVIL